MVTRLFLHHWLSLPLELRCSERVGISAKAPLFRSSESCPHYLKSSTTAENSTTVKHARLLVTRVAPIAAYHARLSLIHSRRKTRSREAFPGDPVWAAVPRHRSPLFCFVPENKAFLFSVPGLFRRGNQLTSAAAETVRRTPIKTFFNGTYCKNLALPEKEPVRSMRRSCPALRRGNA